MQFAKIVALLLVFAALTMAPAGAVPPGALAVEVEALARASNVDGLRAKGEVVMPILADLYRRSDEAGRTSLASIFYQLSFRSEAAKEAMMADVHTENRNLRLQVQWALGRVSNDDAVVDVLLDNLEHDVNPLFRQTGQRKDFVPAAPEAHRAVALAAWKKWLAEYEASLS